MRHELQSDKSLYVSIDDLDDDDLAQAFEVICSAVAERLGPDFIVTAVNIATLPYYDDGGSQVH